MNVIKNVRYIAMPTKHLKDNRLSLTAKGLLSEMIDEQKSDFTLTELMKFGSYDEILFSVAQLYKFGYVKTNVG